MHALSESYYFHYRNQQGNTPLHLACMKKGNIGIVKELLAAASDVNRLLNERYIHVDRGSVI